MSPHIRTFGIAATEFYQLIALPVTQLTAHIHVPLSPSSII